MTDYIESGADISTDGRYRYRLWREWRGNHDPDNWRWLDAVDGDGERLGEPKSCLFVMLNPSTADGVEDDPTIRRCVGFAKAWNYERIEVVNLFAFRATKPRDLLSLHYSADPVGSDNERAIDKAIVRAGLIVCAWGAHGSHLGQDQTMLGWIMPRKCFAFGKTANGQPKHPLFLHANSKLEAFP